jgi:hypothetical protein
MKYRNEVKYIISKNQAKILMQRLSLIMDLDSNTSEDNSYVIRSLYFDDADSNSYYEKLDGILYRRKYRIRLYNGEDKFIRLECKYKHNNMTAKEQALINREICSKIVDGNYDIETTDEKLKKFLIDIKTRHLIPSVIVDYKRVAYTYPISTVRITFDYNIRSGRYNYNLFDNDVSMVNVIDDNMVVLEVKFDEVLPLHIANVLETIPSFRQAVSKFALCRELK